MTEGQQEAFNKLKDTLYTYPLLQYPDFSRPFIVSSDASNYGVGGVLSQELDRKVLPIAYASRTLSDTEVNYSTIEKELLAILFSVETFRPYLYGRQFTLETDHRPLVWLHNVKNPNSKLIRWRLRLNEYDYVIVYKKGIINSNADALSRNPYEGMQTLCDVKDDMTLDEELDPLDPSFHRVHEVLISNQTPVTQSSQHLTKDTNYDACIENAFLKMDHTTFYENNSNCQFTRKKIYEPDSSEEEFETATEESGDEQDELFIDACHEEGYPSGSNDYFDANMSLGPGAIPSIASRDCTSRTEGEAQLDCMLDSAGPGAIPGNASWTALPAPVSDDDRLKDNEFFTEIRGKYNTVIEPDDEDTEDSFEDKDPLQTNSEPKLQKTFIFKQKVKNLSRIKENEIAEDTYQCFPIFHDEPPADKDLTHDDPIPSNFEFSCIQPSKEKLFMRDDNLVLFIPADCRLTTETGQELIEENRLKYDDLQKENPENLQVGNVIVIKYENHCVFNVIIKQNFDSKPHLIDIVAALWALKHAMDELKIESISVSRVGNGLNQISWVSIEDEFRKLFGQGNYQITICYGEIEIPPETDRDKLIREYHSSVTGGHKGSTKTYERIRENFYWPNMRVQIRKFVRECETCKLNKTIRVKTKLPMKITDTPSEAFEKIEMDIVGPLPRTENGNKYILTIQDNLTKYSEAIPLRSTESTVIASAFAEHFITRFGCPQVIHTDQGSDFTSQVMATFCRIFRIKHLRSTAFHPQTLGSLERSHHVLIQYLKNYCEKTNWDKWIRFALFSYNTSKHEGTGFTPHELIFGKQARIPSEFAKCQLPLTYNLYLKTLTEKLAKTQEEARERLHAAKERSKKYYDRKLNGQTYAVGDPVYLQNNTKSSKLDREYSGPYKIVQIFNDNNVELDLGRQKTRIVHMNRLRPQTLKIFPDSK